MKQYQDVSSIMMDYTNPSISALERCFVREGGIRVFSGLLDVSMEKHSAASAVVHLSTEVDAMIRILVHFYQRLCTQNQLIFAGRLMSKERSQE